MSPANAVPDGFDLVNNGTARLTVGSEVWRLRRPKLGEFRKLRELLRDRDDERTALLARQEAGERPDKDAPADEKAAYSLAVAQRSRELVDAVEALNVAWVTEALRTLADREPPAVDDWPAGMETEEFIGALVAHWRTVPLRSGGS